MVRSFFVFFHIPKNCTFFMLPETWIFDFVFQEFMWQPAALPSLPLTQHERKHIRAEVYRGNISQDGHPQYDPKTLRDEMIPLVSIIV